ncbi:hypothetical protein LOTGIDRAFT_160162 [Lottia gigantea]|uniref:Uncharacterized protein n=1 Tax=Lottia gigantea TaxID=225164 RepID=V4C3Q2_LOTGI|nr:hypothetical protein LOTGIDRAFT_160162 [Lottia gigantea]ESO96174.1 hypothetical protein LOTGIDRAFT_160162 [Lottia gigantea]
MTTGNESRMLRKLLELTTESTATSTETPAEIDNGFFAQVSTFYADKNNMAMFLVLPLIVLLYGGCSSIYCISKCRRYLRKRKHKKMAKSEDEERLTENEPNNLNQDMGTDFPKDDTDKNISVFTTDRTTPLPWQVPEKTTTAVVHQSTRGESVISPSNKSKPPTFPQKRPSSRDNSNYEEPIPLQVIPNDEYEIPKRELPEGRRPYSKARFPPIDQPSPVGQMAPVRQVPSPSEKPLNVANRNLIDAALRPSSNGRESVSTIAMKDELLARFDAFSTFAMAKKAADILRVNSLGSQPKEHHGKPKNKLIFIAE